MMGETDRFPADADLVELIEEAPGWDSGSWVHDAIATKLASAASESTGSARFAFELTDTLATVTAWAREFAGRSLGQGATWLRFRDPKRGEGLLAVVHSPLSLTDGGGEADLILVGHRGMLTRGIIRDLCRWCFYGIGLRRVGVRLPIADTAMIELARRAGFEWEGRSRDFYGVGLDASIWAMCATRCRWLATTPPEIPTADISPPSSLKVH